MEKLQNKIDFTLIFEVKNANPNGDPLNGNRPRTNIEDLGEVSDVCLKRKIRNRLQQMQEENPTQGGNVFVQSQDDSNDNCRSLSERFSNLLKENNITVGKKTTTADMENIRELINKHWIDVRSFGQVFAFNSISGFSLGVRGAVSIQSAFSIDPVEIESIQITKSVNSDSTEAGKKSSDTMGAKHRVNYALYRTNGSINPHFAEKNGFSWDDAEKIKYALSTLFENDISSARPEGSMRVVKLFWWEHNSASGNVPSIDLFNSVIVKKKEDVDIPTKLDDYIIDNHEIGNVNCEIIVDKK